MDDKARCDTQKNEMQYVSGFCISTLNTNSQSFVETWACWSVCVLVQVGARSLSVCACAGSCGWWSLAWSSWAWQWEEPSSPLSPASCREQGSSVYSSLSRSPFLSFSLSNLSVWRFVGLSVRPTSILFVWHFHSVFCLTTIYLAVCMPSSILLHVYNTLSCPRDISLQCLVSVTGSWSLAMDWRSLE